MDDAKKGKLRGHYLEIFIVLLLFATFIGFFLSRPTTATRKISFYFKDIQVEANYHKEQILKIQKEKKGLKQLESFHASAYAKLSTEFEDALAKDISLGATKEVLLQEICRSPLHDLQGQYFAAEGANFDMGGPLNETVALEVVSGTLGKLVNATKAARTGLRSCALFDVGSSKSAETLTKILDALAPDKCDTFVYETTRSNVDLLETQLKGLKHPIRVGLKGFWNYTMHGKSAPFKVTTLDNLMAKELQKGEYRENDVVVARIGRMVDDTFWKEIHGGADTIERIAGRRINLSPLQGLDNFLLTKRVTAVMWESFTDDKLRDEVEYVSSHGYNVYIIGHPKFVRVDGHYWDDKFAGQRRANSRFGIAEDYLGTCHFSVSVVAFVEDHPINSFLQQRQLPCEHYRGISCTCENFQASRVYDMC